MKDYPMTANDNLARLLADAHRADKRTVDAALYSGLDREAAFDVQLRVMDLMGETPALLKTAVAPDGVGAVAPIYSSRFGAGGGFSLSSANIIGLELEVGLVLGRDIDEASAQRNEASVVGCIDHFFLGMEVCGTRFIDRSVAGFNGGLADGMSALGYVRSPLPRELGAEIDGMNVELEFAGSKIYFGQSRHSFGTVLASLLAYSKRQRPRFPLKAGTVITTGSLCGLVPIVGTGHVAGRLGDDTIEFDIA